MGAYQNTTLIATNVLVKSPRLSARDIMTVKVVSVDISTPVSEIARLLVKECISAVPVIDGDGALAGMVSEGDLLGHKGEDREAKRSWWLNLIAEGDAFDMRIAAHQESHVRTAASVMSSPAITVGPATVVAEIARIMIANGIKRTPVIDHDGLIVGIVTRADLLRVLAAHTAGRLRLSETAPQNGVAEQHPVHELDLPAFRLADIPGQRNA